MPQGLFEPLWSGPSRLGRRLADMVDPVESRHKPILGEPMMDETLRRTRSMLAGGLEGAGDMASDMTSPLSVGMSLLGISPGIRRLGNAARALRPAGSVVGEVGAEAAPIARGARQAINYADDPEALTQAYQRLGPEFVPIGGEEAFNAPRQAAQLAEKIDIRKRAEEAEQAYRKVHGWGRSPNPGTMDDNAQEALEFAARRNDAKARPRSPKAPPEPVAPQAPAEGRWTAKDISDSMSGMGPTEGIPMEGVGPSPLGMSRAMEAMKRQQAIEMARQRVLRMQPRQGPLPEGF